MSKVKVKGLEYDEEYISRLIKRDKGAMYLNRVYKKQCGNCQNDLSQPYNYCRFCGYKVNENPELFKGGYLHGTNR